MTVKGQWNDLREGAQVTLVPTLANADYKLLPGSSKFYNDDHQLVSVVLTEQPNGEFTFPMPACNLEVECTFVPASYRPFVVTLKPGIQHGDLKVKGKFDDLREGGVVTLQAVPSEVNFQYEPGSLKFFNPSQEPRSLDVTDKGNGEFTFPMPAHDVTVVCAFEEKLFTLTLLFDVARGRIAVDEADKLHMGQETKFWVGAKVNNRLVPGSRKAYKSGAGCYLVYLRDTQRHVKMLLPVKQ